MIVTDKLGFIAHPNTGTRSIRAALESIGGREVGGYHEVHVPSLELLVFCTLRNPWDLMASWFFRTIEGKMDFNEWLPMTFGGLRHYEGPGELFYGYQYSDMFMRFESLQEDFGMVLKESGSPTIALGHIGKTKRPQSYRDLYNGASRCLVGSLYEQQIHWGKYKF